MIQDTISSILNHSEKVIFAYEVETKNLDLNVQNVKFENDDIGKEKGIDGSEIVDAHMNEGERNHLLAFTSENLYLLTPTKLIGVTSPNPSLIKDQIVKNGIEKNVLDEWIVSLKPQVKIKLSLDRITRVWNDERVFGVDFFSMGKKREIEGIEWVGKDEMSAFGMVEAMKRVQEMFWQKLVEDGFLPDDEHYQWHVMARKINRKGGQEIRTLIGSNKKIYLSKMQPDKTFQKATVRWALTYDCFMGIRWYKKNPLVLGLILDKGKAKKQSKKAHASYDFVCPHVEEKIRVTELMKHFCQNSARGKPITEEYILDKEAVGSKD